MATFLFNDIIFGPVKSRRLGSSLGINLLPADRKICTFNCIYCECGWTGASGTSSFPGRGEIASALSERLQSMAEKDNLPDSITYAGNGEPSLHPDFDHIIYDSIKIRDKYAPQAKIAVLSNAAFPPESRIFKALKQVDLNILKLDTGLESTFKLLNQPGGKIKLADIIQNLKGFNGKLIIQTMFVRGIYKGKKVDNSSLTELKELFRLYQEIKPEAIMLYTYERDTAASGLEKVPLEDMKKIAKDIEGLGIETLVSF